MSDPIHDDDRRANDAPASDPLANDPPANDPRGNDPLANDPPANDPPVPPELTRFLFERLAAEDPDGGVLARHVEGALAPAEAARVEALAAAEPAVAARLAALAAILEPPVELAPLAPPPELVAFALDAVRAAAVARESDASELEAAPVAATLAATGPRTGTAAVASAPSAPRRRWRGALALAAALVLAATLGALGREALLRVGESRVAGDRSAGEAGAAAIATLTARLERAERALEERAATSPPSGSPSPGGHAERALELAAARSARRVLEAGRAAVAQAEGLERAALRAERDALAAEQARLGAEQRELRAEQERLRAQVDARGRAQVAQGRQLARALGELARLREDVAALQAAAARREAEGVGVAAAAGILRWDVASRRWAPLTPGPLAAGAVLRAAAPDARLEVGAGAQRLGDCLAVVAAGRVLPVPREPTAATLAPPGGGPRPRPDARDLPPGRLERLIHLVSR